MIKKIKIKSNNTIHPINSVYISTDNVSPASLFGGKWERIKDLFLLAAGDKFILKNKGGEENHTLSINEIPAHGHRVQGTTGTAKASGQIRVVKTTSNSLPSSNWNNHMSAPGTTSNYEDAIQGAETEGRFPGSYHHHYFSANAQDTGGSYSHNNMPPYLVVSIWKRTA